jgi:hypothetical protein
MIKPLLKLFGEFLRNVFVIHTEVYSNHLVVRTEAVYVKLNHGTVIKGLHVKLMYLVSPKRPDRPWGLPDHLFSSYRRLFLRAETAGA